MRATRSASSRSSMASASPMPASTGKAPSPCSIPWRRRCAPAARLAAGPQPSATDSPLSPRPPSVRPGALFCVEERGDQQPRLAPRREEAGRHSSLLRRKRATGADGEATSNSPSGVEPSIRGLPHSNRADVGSMRRPGGSMALMSVMKRKRCRSSARRGRSSTEPARSRDSRRVPRSR